MRFVLTSIMIAASVMFFGSPTFGRQAAQDEFPSHRHVATTVAKVQSGVVFFHPAAGLEPRAVSVHKAERMGLYQAKEGDEVVLLIDENNLLIDLHRKDVAPAGHRLVAGRLTYADPMWEVIEITNSEGTQTYAVDGSAGSKLSLLKEGTVVRAEVNEDNYVVDIHPSR